MSRNPRRHQIHQRPRLLALAGLLSGLAVASTSPAQADQIIKDLKGRTVARIEPSAAGDDYSVVYDQKGKRIGTIEREDDDRQIVRDNKGRRVGVIDREPDDTAQKPLERAEEEPE